VHDVGRLRFVRVHARRHKDPIWAEPARGDARHRRANPEFARLVTRGANDAALGGRASDNHRFAAKRRAIALFDGCIKSVHIKMKYHPAHNLETDASIWGILSFSLKSALLLTWRVNEG